MCNALEQAVFQLFGRFGEAILWYHNLTFSFVSAPFFAILTAKFTITLVAFAKNEAVNNNRHTAIQIFRAMTARLVNNRFLVHQAHDSVSFLMAKK